jgi:hypothetical protein
VPRDLILKENACPPPPLHHSGRVPQGHECSAIVSDEEEQEVEVEVVDYG